MSDRSRNFSLHVLSLAYFCMGTASLAVVGTLPRIAASLDLGEGCVAFLVSAFAVTFAASAPTLQMLVGHWSRKRLVLLGLALLAAGTLGSALVSSYPLLLAMRVIAAIGAAALGPGASALGASLVTTEQRGHALAVVFSGMTIATVVGVPLSTWLGAAIGWRPTFVLIGLATLAAAGLIAVFVEDGGPGQRVNARDLFATLVRPVTASGIVVMVLEMAGVFASYTMIVPMLRDRFLVGAEAVSAALMVYGLAGILGNLLVRRLARLWSADRAVAVALLGLMSVFFALRFAPPQFPFALAILVFWAIGSDVFMPSQQRRMLELAPQAGGLALALNASAIYVGMAAGSFAAGSLAPVVGLGGLPLVSLTLLGASFAALWMSRHVARRKHLGAVC
ncbi:MAG: MFS transporter [Acidihalobacter sp.]|uniref:MFS transporter n=1 Tax=Acidihalobacter sp. TaxID=1872108 RepID=UPI00307F08C0